MRDDVNSVDALAAKSVCVREDVNSVLTCGGAGMMHRPARPQTALPLAMHAEEADIPNKRLPAPWRIAFSKVQPQYFAAATSASNAMDWANDLVTTIAAAVAASVALLAALVVAFFNVALTHSRAALANARVIPYNTEAKKWTPPTGYVPKGQEKSGESKGRSWASPAGYVPGWASQMGDNTNIAPSVWDQHDGATAKQNEVEHRGAAACEQEAHQHAYEASRLEVSCIAQRTIQKLLDEQPTAIPAVRRKKQQQKAASLECAKKEQQKASLLERARTQQQKASSLEHSQALALEQYAMTLYRTIYAPAWQLPAQITTAAQPAAAATSSSSAAAPVDPEHLIALTCIFLQVHVPAALDVRGLHTTPLTECGVFTSPHT